MRDKLHAREANMPDQQLRCPNTVQWKGCEVAQTVRMLAWRQPSFKQCVIADSSSDLAPIMIGDKRYTEALEDVLVRQDGLVGERS